MKKKLLILAAAAVLLLSGCSHKITSAVIAGQAYSNLQKTKSAVMDLDLKLGADVDTSALSQSLLGIALPMGEHATGTISLSMTCETTSDPSAMHGTGGLNLGIPLLGDIPMDIYTVPEGDDTVMYTNIMGMYGRKVLPAPEEGAQEKEPWYKALFGAWKAVSDDTLSMEEGTVTRDEKECYLVHARFPSSLIYDFLTSSADLSILQKEGAEVDFGDQKTPADIYIDKETLLPYVLTVSDTDFVNTITAQTKLSGISLNAMDLTVTFKSFNSVDEVAVPQEFKDAAAR
ncbi:MAG: hypothetical protein II774_06330 [Lachnospiraceae bacterium]|nr:hypothetical protein [Lachnospiraceae bacterium]